MMCWKKAGLLGVLFFMLSGCRSIEPIQHSHEAEAESLSAVQMKELPFQHLQLHVQYGQKKRII